MYFYKGFAYGGLHTMVLPHRVLPQNVGPQSVRLRVRAYSMIRSLAAVPVVTAGALPGFYKKGVPEATSRDPMVLLVPPARRLGLEDCVKGVV